MTDSATARRKPWKWLFTVAATLAVGALAISHQSLWMDEGSTAFKALMPTFADWKFFTFRLGGSDVQMPVYMLLVWGWVKLGFLSEYGLRLVNLPFLLVMVLALRHIRFWPLVCLVSPFVLYYAGELRPYTMQMAAGALAVRGLLEIATGRAGRPFHGLHTAAGGALLLVAASLTSAVWAGGVALAVAVLQPAWLRRSGFWLRTAPWALAAGGLMGYYAYTLHLGYRAAATGGGGGLLSMGFGFYEMAGMMGLGPSRDELRASPLALLPRLPVLVPALLCVGYAWLAGVRDWLGRTEKRLWLAAAAALLAPMAILAGVGLVADFRVLGRHLSPAVPAVLLPLAGFLQLSLRRGAGTRAIAAAACAFWFGSAVFLRFQPRHFRDDYRTASALAFDALAQGKRILWQADMNATRYYAFRKGGLAMVNAIQRLESSPPGLMFADFVVINRPDNRYRGIDYQADLRRNDFVPDRTFTGFEIWKLPY